MAKQVTSTAMLKCSFGTAPCTFQVLPKNMVTVEGKPAATIMDNVPMLNISTFGMCQAPSNPQVAAATAAASGVLTPQPCIPAITAPWTPGSPQVLINSMPALNDSSKCMCMWGGVIEISLPGATKDDIP